MSSTAWVKNALDIGNLHYERSRHPDAFTAQEVAKREHVSGHQVAKVVAIEADGKPVLLVLPASRRVAISRAREALGAKAARLLGEAEMSLLFPDCEVGAIPPMRHWAGVEIVMDGTLQTEKSIVFSAGSHRDSIKVPFSEWFDLVGPRVESFSVPGDWPSSGSTYDEET